MTSERADIGTQRARIARGYRRDPNRRDVCRREEEETQAEDRLSRQRSSQHLHPLCQHCGEKTNNNEPTTHRRGADEIGDLEEGSVQGELQGDKDNIYESTK